MPVNYFADADVAGRYAAGRPYFHPVVVSRFSQVAGGDLPLGLDVACGTGQSAQALSAAAHKIVAVDAALEMLRYAIPHDAIIYAAASAERLPFKDGIFDVVTVGLGFHWFERIRFVSEAERVLRRRGWLLIYDNWFTGRMRGNPDFNRWFRESYLRAYPSPPRDRRPLSTAEAKAGGLAFVLREQFSNVVIWTAPELVEYLCTQTNVRAVVGGASSLLIQAERTLSEQVAPHFRGNEGTFEFDGFIWLLQKAVQPGAEADAEQRS